MWPPATWAIHLRRSPTICYHLAPNFIPKRLGFSSTRRGKKWSLRGSARKNQISILTNMLVLMETRFII